MLATEYTGGLSTLLQNWPEDLVTSNLIDLVGLTPSQ